MNQTPDQVSSTPARGCTRWELPTRDPIGAIRPQGELLPFQAQQEGTEGVRSALCPGPHCSLALYSHTEHSWLGQGSHIPLRAAAQRGSKPQGLESHAPNTTELYRATRSAPSSKPSRVVTFTAISTEQRGRGSDATTCLARVSPSKQVREAHLPHAIPQMHPGHKQAQTANRP